MTEAEAQGLSQRPIKSRRRFYPKSRSGCLTCKLRRVKCDETRPECNRCRRSGRKCEGYTTFPLTISATPLSCREARSHRYFCERTLIDLSSLHGWTVWKSLVLQATETQPALMHALVCIGAFHECVESSRSGNVATIGHAGSMPKSSANTDVETLRLFALQQYNKSIGLLTDATITLSLEQILIACLLFIAVENLQHNCRASVDHLQSGLNIIDQYRLSQTGSSSASTYMDDHLAPVFARLDLQVFAFVEGYSPRYSIMPRTAHIEDQTPALPYKFYDLLEVRRSLELHLRWQLRLLGRHDDTNSQSDPSKSNRSVICDRFKELYDKIDNYNSRVKTQDPHFRRSMAFLKIFYHIVMITTRTSNTSSECALDGQIDDFRGMLFWIDEFIRRGEGPFSPVRVSYSFELGVVPILSGIACSCREPAIRRRAVSLLRTSRRREALWDSFLAACVCERVIEIEERGLGIVRSCSDIPEISRVRVTSILIDMERSPNLHDNDLDHWFGTSGWLGVEFTRYPHDAGVTAKEEEWSNMDAIRKSHVVNNPNVTTLPRQIHRQSWRRDNSKGFPSVFGVPFIWSWLTSTGSAVNLDEPGDFSYEQSIEPFIQSRAFRKHRPIPIRPKVIA